jgi:hypothetical protein
MARDGESAVRLQPRGVSDTFSGNNSPSGAMTFLTNLIHDSTTPGCFICRPANTKLIDFSGWGAAPGNTDVVTGAFQVGNIIYGLVGITSGSFSGLDYPFAFNTATGAFLTVTGITTAKCPTSQPTSGAWVPPQMTLTGTKLVVTHVGFDGATHYFGVFDVTTPTAPVWNALNTSTNTLPAVPQGCGSFNNRTYFLVGNTAYYTDTLSLSMATSTQSLTVGDYTNATCMAPLPVGTTSQGVVQGILIFKLSQTFLLTGDAVTMNLSLNQLSSSVGTAAPRSVVSTPEGVVFMAVDGIRIVSFLGVISPPSPDLSTPFSYALVPSRVAAAYNSDIYRICTQNGAVQNSPYQDYWYNLKYKSWCGPHSFRYDLAIPLGNDFVLASNTLPGSMWDSFTLQGHAGQGSSFIENGTQLIWVYQTAPMTDLDNIYANSVIRSTIEIARPASGQTYTFIAENEAGTLLAQAQITAPISQAVWGAFNWGQANWGASNSGLVPLDIPWDQTIVFNNLVVNGSGESALGFKISSLHSAYKRLNYLLN